MDRRHFMRRSAVALASTSIFHETSQAQTTFNISNFDPLTELYKTQLNVPNSYGGLYNGCFLTNQASGAYLNWYFNNLALTSFVGIIPRAYLEAYLQSYINNAKIDPYYRVFDRTFSNFSQSFSSNNLSNPGNVGFRTDPNTGVIIFSDSDDSYAATFLTLMMRYLYQYKDNQAKSFCLTNLNTLKGIAYANIANNIDPNSGLSRVYQPSSNSSQTTGYLMDNCEAYRGLRDFADLISYVDVLDQDAFYYQNWAESIKTAIYNKLLKSTAYGTRFLASNAASASDPLASLKFYADQVGQIFPQALLVTHPNMSLISSTYNNAWNFLNRPQDSSAANLTGYRWTSGTSDGAFPWMMIGYVSAVRANYTDAVTQMKSMIGFYNSSLTKSKVPIHEIGWYQRAKALIPSNLLV